MEYIDIHHQILLHSIIPQQQTSINSNFRGSPLNIRQFPSKYTSTFQFNTILTSCQGRSVINKVNFVQNQQIRFMIQLLNSAFIRCKTSNQKILVLKYFLKVNRNRNPYYFRLNPISGEINFSINFVFGTSWKLYLFKVIDEIWSYVTDQFDIIKQEFRKLLEILGQQLNDQQFSEIKIKKNNFNKQLKSYIISSQHYAWNIFEKSTQSSKFDESHSYNEKKKMFRSMRNVIMQNQRIEKLSKILNEKKQNMLPVFKLKASEDEQLNLKYLQLSKSFNKECKLINQITVNQKENIKISKTNQFKVITKELGKIKIHIQCKQNIQSIKYQKKLLSQFPTYEFIGLPKYYLLKQSIPTQNIVVTNLYQCKDLSLFLKSNSQSLSHETKLQLLLQIAKAMKYLKDNFALYHNLIPNVVKIKRGMIIKLSDFTSSYHQNIVNQDLKYQPYKNKFPYVSNICYGKYTTIQNQKSDSYSLGALMYKVLFQTNFINVKQSTLKALDQNKKFKILSKKYPKPIIDGNKNSIQSNLLIKFILDSISHQRIQNLKNGLNQQLKDFDKMSISQRPYLDWFSIIISYTYEHHLNTFN